MRRMRFARCSGASATTVMMATQFGLAMRPRCAGERVGVHLGHDERHVGLHAEGRGIVDDDGATRRGGARDAARDGGTCREECEVDAAQAVHGELLDGERAAAEMQSAPGGAAGGEQAQRAEREAALLEAVDELGPDRARGADDRDGGGGRNAARGGRRRGFAGGLERRFGCDLIQAHDLSPVVAETSAWVVRPRRAPAGPWGCYFALIEARAPKAPGRAS